MLKNKIITAALILLMIFSALFVNYENLKAAERLDLSTAIEMALKNNRNFEAARNKLLQAEKQSEAAKTIMNSKLFAETAWQSEELNQSGDFIASLNYQKLLAQSKGTKAVLQKAELELLIAKLNFDKNREEVLHNLIKQYYAILSINEKIESQKVIIEEAESFFADAKARYDDGLLTEADLLELEINLDKSLDALANLKNEEQRAKEHLARLTAYQETDFIVQAPEKDFEVYEAREMLIEKALNNRSDYLTQELELEIIKSEIAYLDSEKRADLNLRGEYIFEDGRIKAAFNDDYQLSLKGSFDTIDKELVDRDMLQSEETIKLIDNLTEESEWKITASISYEFSDGGRKKAESKALEAGYNALHLNREDLEEELKIEIKHLVNKIREAEQKLLTAEKNLEKSRLQYQSSKNRFEQGAINQSQLITSQRLFREAEDNKINADYNLSLTKLELLAYLEIIYQEIFVSSLEV
ncbi:TolC family protein [Halanaerobium hydrogeniformans]|uniref:Outer membrane efflux protein n=1 Tax=Halanaerobium hydrogeniformans TaxID=656519 RepID=E4RMY8_HALHG|nr:TolC family protein [Halanaerobium hydrogeniformans]ADQ14205.1 outer membrane efflux protein [Halanaerobium hydrogeniformans]